MGRYCTFCGTEKNVKSLFLDFDTKNNDRRNLIPACRNCIGQYQIKRASEAVKVLKKLGFKCDKKGRWKYNNKLVRSELFDERYYKTRIVYLEQQIEDLKWYIKTLEQKGLEPYDQESINDKLWKKSGNLSRL